MTGEERGGLTVGLEERDDRGDQSHSRSAAEPPGGQDGRPPDELAGGERAQVSLRADGDLARDAARRKVRGGQWVGLRLI